MLAGLRGGLAAGADAEFGEDRGHVVGVGTTDHVAANAGTAGTMAMVIPTRTAARNDIMRPRLIDILDVSHLCQTFPA
jgi:hypothetical protein